MSKNFTPFSDATQTYSEVYDMFFLECKEVLKEFNLGNTLEYLEICESMVYMSIYTPFSETVERITFAIPISVFDEGTLKEFFEKRYLLIRDNFK